MGSPSPSDPDFVDAVARRVVELLRDEHFPAAAGTPRLMTVAQVSREFGVSPHWVYAHAAALGVIRLGSGPRARLRFERDTIATRISRLGSNGRGPRPRTAKPAATSNNRGELLPINNPRVRPSHERG